MKKAFDITSVRLTLRDGIAKGYWTLEQLDTPSMGWQENAKTFRLNHPKYPQPEYVNPLRTPDPDPAVQLSDPRDFTPTEGTTPAQPLDLPLTPEELDW
jgi:hypothetical protein